MQLRNVETRNYKYDYIFTPDLIFSLKVTYESSDYLGFADSLSTKTLVINNTEHAAFIGRQISFVRCMGAIGLNRTATRPKSHTAHILFHLYA